MFLMVKLTSLNVVSRNVVVYENAVTAINEDLLYSARDQLSRASFPWISSVPPGNCRCSALKSPPLQFVPLGYYG
jgi:hypothetical protein